MALDLLGLLGVFVLPNPESRKGGTSHIPKITVSKNYTLIDDAGLICFYHCQFFARDLYLPLLYFIVFDLCLFIIISFSLSLFRCQTDYPSISLSLVSLSSLFISLSLYFSRYISIVTQTLDTHDVMCLSVSHGRGYECTPHLPQLEIKVEGLNTQCQRITIDKKIYSNPNRIVSLSQNRVIGLTRVISSGSFRS